jgi:hypothetical protein
MLSLLLTITFAEDITKVIQAVESNAKIFYNGKEISFVNKTLLYNGNIYLPASGLEGISDRSIVWNAKENKLIISNRPNTEAEGLKKELESRDKSISLLNNTIKDMQQELSLEKVLTVKGLQDKLNSEFETYNDLSHHIFLSGNEDEVRVKIAIDLSLGSGMWYGLSSSKKTEFLEAISEAITNEYNHAKVRGFVKDISKAKKLISFCSTSNGDIKTVYAKSSNPISVMEEKFNDNYDAFFSGICIIYDLNGSENKIDISAGIDMSRYDSQWDKLSDSRVKGLLSKLVGEINAQYKDCEINGVIYDTNTEEELASCYKYPKQEFSFSRSR